MDSCRYAHTSAASTTLTHVVRISGCFMTCAALVMAAKNLGKDSNKLQFWFRMRVAAQALTVVAIVGGSYIVKNKQEATRELSFEEQRARERAEWEARMRAAEAAHAEEKAMGKFAAAEERTIFQKLGLGRGSLKSREAIAAADTVPPPPPAPAVVEPPPAAAIAPTTAASPTTASASTTSAGDGWGWFGSSKPK